MDNGAIKSVVRASAHKSQPIGTHYDNIHTKQHTARGHQGPPHDNIQAHHDS